MDAAYLHDLECLAKKIQEYTRELCNYRALLEGREILAKGLRNKYPNMKIEAIRSTLWKQEREQANKAQFAFDEMRMFTISCGWNIIEEYKYVAEEVKGILRKEIINFNDINV